MFNRQMEEITISTSLGHETRHASDNVNEHVDAIRERKTLLRMLNEMLMVLAGHPSAFFQEAPAGPSRHSTLTTSSRLSEYLHPGEVTSLDNLANLGYRYRAIRDWATDTRRRGQTALVGDNLRNMHKGKGKEVDAEGSAPGVYLVALAEGILQLLVPYETLVVGAEARILAMDTRLVQDDNGYVPLSTLVAEFDGWQTPLAFLEDLIRRLSEPGSRAAGNTIDLIRRSMNTGHPEIKRMCGQLLRKVEALWLKHLSAFLLFGVAPSLSTPNAPAIGIDAGSDPLSPQHRAYILNDGMLPSCLTASTRESILYVGRVSATLRQEGKGLPKHVIAELGAKLMSAGLEDGLQKAIDEARGILGEWLWEHVLTGKQVSEVLNTFGNYFLLRDGQFSSAVIREFHRLEMAKIITSNPKSSSSVIREHDLNNAMLRASVRTGAESDAALDNLSWRMDNGPLRPVMPSLSASLSRPQRNYSESSSQDIFASSLLGTPLRLTLRTGWPIDLFIVPSIQSAYTELHAFLMAFRDAHLRVLDCWSSLSAAQRRRRKWTGATEGGSREEMARRRGLARLAWGIVRAMLFFLDQLQSHFMTDIIDVQHRRLIDELGSPAPPSDPLRRSATAQSLKHSDSKPSNPVDRQSDGSATARPTPASPVGASGRTGFVDFLTLRHKHSRHLSFLREGLLIAHRPTASLMSDILGTCRRFAGLVERWGGDVVPELLLDGDERGDVAKDRADTVGAIHETFQDQLADFFRILLESRNPIQSSDVSSSAAGLSFSRTARTLHLSRAMSRQISFGSAQAGRGNAAIGSQPDGKTMEAEAAMGRHVEQLLLRLDFNGVLSDRIGLESEGATGENVLA